MSKMPVGKFYIPVGIHLYGTLYGTIHVTLPHHTP